jgi:glucose 1-dehydrogenase
MPLALPDEPHPLPVTVESRPYLNHTGRKLMRLANKVAIVTGATQGIGLACAQRLVAEGASVMLADINPDGEAAAAALGERARFFAADVSQKSDVDALVAAALQAFGRIDILVNNVGVTHAVEFLDLAEDDFDRVIRINLKSMFLCGQAVAREMVKQASGCIINMSSVNAEVAIMNQVPYSISKGGINQLTRVMSLNLAQHGIRVNGIGPGTILTELAKQAVLGSPEARNTILSRTPLGRCGEPEEVASIAAFLASDDASYMTGQTIYVDGGRLALNYTVPVRE